MKHIGKPGYIRWLLCAAGLVLLPLPHQAASVAMEGPPDIRRDATVNAIEAAMPSVVNIATSGMVEHRDFYDELRREFFGQPPAQRRTEEKVHELGSGIIIDEDGYILSNWHVVRRGTRVQVKLSDGRLYEADKIVATTKSDVALLKLRAKPGEKFEAIKFAPDDDLLLGETVIALGNPFGLGGSVSRGILSSKTRRPESGNEPLNIADWLQTDAAINPGNSGGPLINLRGELIGLNVAVYNRAQGIGFAIPVKQVSAALAQFFSPEVNYSLWFGARLKPNTFPLEIAEVQPGSPASKAGLKTGMQVVSVNGKTPRSVVDFNEQIMTGEGHSVALIVVENGQRRPVPVKLMPFEELIRQRTGLTLQEITPQMAARLRWRDGQGLLIEKVEPGSPAAAAELKSGMLLTGFGQTAINEVRDMGMALTSASELATNKLSLIVPQQISNGQVQLRQATAEIKLR